MPQDYTSTARTDYDIVVIGGGINGCGIARDAAGRGYAVMLAEMGDLASGTSSAATKLVHGGLRYLEQYEFRLVRESLAEREVLLASAPHIIRPLRFVLPHHRDLRPALVIRAGLLVYDTLGGRKLLQRSRSIDLTADPAGLPLKPQFERGFEYSDCWVDDARLVVLNARDAADRGARIDVRTRVVAARRDGGRWLVEVEDETGRRMGVRARLLVNAAGPWADRVLREVVGVPDARNVRLVKGSHIVVEQKFEHPKAYIFQGADRRVVFAIPYEGRFTLIGTTDEEFAGDPGSARINAGEIAYLCEATSGYFRQPVKPADVVWSYAGVRALSDDAGEPAQEASRDYQLRVDGDATSGALINVFGGKLTTYRRLAEATLGHIEELLGARGPAWTKAAHLPGGDFAVRGGYELEVERLASLKPGLPRRLIKRLIRHYGTDATAIIGGANVLADMGPRFGADLTGSEVRHLVEREWARTAGDVLWRRSKLGLTLPAAEATRLQAHMHDLLEDLAA